MQPSIAVFIEYPCELPRKVHEVIVNGYHQITSLDGFTLGGQESPRDLRHP